MDILTTIYLFYIFVAIYFLTLFILIYVGNKKEIYFTPKPKRNYDLSIVVPCYNEEKSIGQTIEALLNSSYKGLKKIFVVDDCSRDNSFQIIKKYARLYPKKVVALQTPSNTGKASGSKNYGAKFVKTELVGFTDADSYPKKDAVLKMVGFFNEDKVAAVTSAVLVKERKKLIEILQSVEYKIILFTRKLLGFVDAIYVTPGPLAVYRKKYFDEVGGFDEKNLTEDIEITWNFVSNGYTVKMSLDSRVYTVAPSNFKDWFKQRIRWNVGGLQTISKYKKDFFKKGMLGGFILPFFLFNWILGIVGISILIYRGLRRMIIYFLSSIFSVNKDVAVLTLREINLAPTVLFFFGVAVILLSFSFTLIALLYSRETEFKRHGILIVFVYMFVYLLAYPFILLISGYKFLKKSYSW